MDKNAYNEQVSNVFTALVKYGYYKIDVDVETISNNSDQKETFFKIIAPYIERCREEAKIMEDTGEYHGIIGQFDDEEQLLSSPRILHHLENQTDKGIELGIEWIKDLEGSQKLRAQWEILKDIDLNDLKP